MPGVRRPSHILRNQTRANLWPARAWFKNQSGFSELCSNVKYGKQT